jgi:hypothetical protein
VGCGVDNYRTTFLNGMAKILEDADLIATRYSALLLFMIMKGRHGESIIYWPSLSTSS